MHDMNVQAETAFWSTTMGCQTDEITRKEIGVQTKEMMKNEKKDKNENKPLPKSKLQLELEKDNQKNEKDLVDKTDQIQELKKQLKEMQK